MLGQFGGSEPIDAQTFAKLRQQENYAKYGLQVETGNGLATNTAKYGSTLGAGGMCAYDYEDLCRSSGHRGSIGPDTCMARNDFRLAMLIRLGKIRRDDLTLIDAVFNALGPDESSDSLSLATVVKDNAASMHRRTTQLDLLCGAD